MIAWLFSKAWYFRLRDEAKGVQNKVVRVKGWRSAIIETPYGSRRHVWFCFWWLK